MLENFRKIYNNELSGYDYSEFELFVLGSRTVRMFVYEVCKVCIASQPSIQDGSAELCDNWKCVFEGAPCKNWDICEGYITHSA